MSAHSCKIVYQELYELVTKLKEDLSKQEDKTQDSLGDIEAVSVKLLNISPEKIPKSLVSQWQSLVTESHRMLRLLKNDLMFFKAAKNAATQNLRRKIIEERLEKLDNFAKLLIEIDEKSDIGGKCTD